MSSRVCKPGLVGALLVAAPALLVAAVVISPSRAQSAGRVVIAGSGDLLVHLRVIASAQHHEGGFDHVLGPLGSIVDRDEVAFANLETPLSMERPPRTGEPPVLGAPAEVAAALARAGIDVLSVANNHAYDQYATGLARTIEVVREAGILPVGAGPDEAAAFAPAQLTRGGLRVSFLALTERINGRGGSPRPVSVIAQWHEDAQIARALETARASCDVLVVSIHWSFDYWEEPTHAQRRRARFLIEHGADVILGHGPHVLHEVERMPSPRGDALVAYSLGNLVSNQGPRYWAGRTNASGAHPSTWLGTTRDGVWLRVPVEVAGGRVHVGAVTGVPLFTYNNFWARDAGREEHEDIHIQRLRDVADLELRDERRGAIARALGSEVTLSE